MEKIREYIYWLIIFCLSVLSCGLLPMVGSQIGLGWQLPTDTAGWIVFWVTKGIIGVINIIFFVCFMGEGKRRASKTEKYKEAVQILDKTLKRDTKPRSPAKWLTKQYSTKGIMIFITSILSTFALTQCILTFDIASFVGYLITVTLGCVFGLLQMVKAEDYWTNEFYAYAKGEQK